MPITANNFVWTNAPSANAVPETITTDKPLADDFANVVPKSYKKTAEEAANDEFIPLSDDGTIKVKRSQYTEDMMGTEATEDINITTDNKKE